MIEILLILNGLSRRAKLRLVHLAIVRLIELLLLLGFWCSLCHYLTIVALDLLTRTVLVDVVEFASQELAWRNVFERRSEMAIVDVGAVQDPHLLLLHLQIQYRLQVLASLPALHFDLTV